MRLTFYGAARQVTGSMFLLEFDDDYRVLIDCGSNMDRGAADPEAETHPRPYGHFPFDASLVNVVMLTHAHLDHSGQIPTLYQEGFEGQVLCTNPTIDLTRVLLEDSASLNQRKVKMIQKSRSKSKKWKDIESRGLYLKRQVDEALENFVPIAFNHRFRFKDDGYVTFYPAGHLLGAAHIVIEVKEEGRWKKIAFSGDIGRQNYPLLVDPTPLPEVDYVVMESTYGNRLHDRSRGAEEVLAEIIEEVCVKSVGRLIIPAFSVGRTQALLYTLNKVYQNNNFSPIKVFTDSPLAKETSKIYERFTPYLNQEATTFREENDHLFDFENLYYLETSEASKSVSNHTEPCIIVSASGMVQGGRVEYHVAQNIGNPYATVLLIGYATEGTLGYQLLTGERKELSIHGKVHPFLANIKKIDVFSGHGDLQDLLTFAASQQPQTLKKVFLVHGELEPMQNLRHELNKRGFTDVEIPTLGQTFEL